MARGGRSRGRELPPPLPPAERTVGQLVAESIRLYGSAFWKGLALGIPVVLVNAFIWASPDGDARLLALPLSILVIPVSFVAASALVTGSPLWSRSSLVAYVVAVLVFVPFPILATFFVLPGLVWLAFFGLAVPAAIAERLGVRAALSRGLQLARVDYVHVLGGLATLALVVFLTQAVLFFVLREYAENTQRVAAALASLVISPILFLGGALLYVDQEARLRSRERRGKE